MSQMNERGARSERGSALWGTGGRGGDRSSVLWGKGGRSALIATVVFAFAAPLAATASPGKKPAPAPVPVLADPAAPDASNGNNTENWVAPGLLAKAASNPNDKVDVIITSSGGTGAADKAVKWLAKLAGTQSGDLGAEKSLDAAGGVALSLPARLVLKLQKVAGLTITPDAPVKLAGTTASASTSSQLWPFESGNSLLWLGDQAQYAGKLPAIAVVDSGIQQRSDFGSRLVASVNLSTIEGNSSLDDERGHGTFVASIAAGNAAGLAGAAPTAPLVSVKVMNKDGMAKTSDVINACQWILDNKGKYNIRVANFSLHSSYGTNSYRDPLDKAVEKLWFNGVTVVAAAGNYGVADRASGVIYAPGNDPFVITVGAVDLGNSFRSNDDAVASWSAYGYTEDGFYKPEVAAPGRFMVGAIPSGSTLAAQKASNLVGSDRIQLSGTSFAAPIVAGTAAQILARHPDWTPDQVKGALMRSARKVRGGNPAAAGLGEITASRAASAGWAPNANLGLDKFVVSASDGSGLVFDAQSWASSAKASMSWDSMSWTDQSWSDQSWSDQSWASMSWTDMSWTDMSWTDMSWTDMSWTDSSTEDAAEGDATAGSDGYVAPDTVAYDAASDPDVAVMVDGLDPLAALGVTATSEPVATTTDPVSTTTDPVSTTTDPVSTTTTVVTTSTSSLLP